MRRLRFLRVLERVSLYAMVCSFSVAALLEWHMGELSGTWATTVVVLCLLLLLTNSEEAKP